MPIRTLWPALVCAAVLSCLASPSTGAESVDAPIPLKDFARHPTVMQPRLSPDGKHLAVRMDDPDGAHHALVVYQLSDMKISSLLRMPKYEVPLTMAWVSPTQLVIEKGRVMGSLDQPRSLGEIISTAYDGSHQQYLYGYKPAGRRASTRSSDRGWGSIEGFPREANGHFFMGAQPWDSETMSRLYNVDAEHNVRHLIGDIHVPGMSFLIDDAGRATFAFGTNADFDYVAYQKVGDRWAQLPSTRTGRHFAPFAYTPDDSQLYAMWSKDGGPSQLILEAPDGSRRSTLASDPFSSIGDLQWTSKPVRPFAAISSAGRPTPKLIDATLPDAKLYLALERTFPGQFVDFLDYSEDGRTLLFAVSSDRNPGTYYLIDTQSHKVTKLFDAEPWIKPAQMAERRPFRFKASDGLELEGILTIPPRRGESNLPMVLLPHGGPHGIRDSWFYDDDAQMLASRGYLVLQVNYRGSGGRGPDFEQAGYRQWGTRIQQDLIDGVKWAIANQYADAGRICVFGGSFGGYSAMMSVIRAPKLFKCAVGYAGIYDLPMMYEKGDIRERKSGRSYLTTVIGKDEQALRENSPDRLAERIDVPVLLVHGKDDDRAPFAQAEAMRDALEKAHKPYEWMAVDGEGHGFYDEQHNIDFYTKLLDFLGKHIGPGAPVVH